MTAQTVDDSLSHDAGTRQSDRRARLRHTAGELFGLDLRSLALLRICLGLLILIDLVCRSRDLVAHYTDAGVLPREAARQLIARPWSLSLHMLGGSAAFEAALFVVAGATAVLLMLGWRTRLVTLLCWVMMLSLHARNPAILNGGDLELKLLLFWGMFLPLGARWSIDRLLADCRPAEDDLAADNHPLDAPSSTDSQQYLSLGTFAYVWQIILIYLLAGLLKDGDTWLAGTAVEQAMRVDFYGRPLRHALLAHPDLMRWLTHFTLNLETYGWLLLLVPWRQGWFRLAAIVLFVGMHVGFELTMTLGMFPWIGISAWTALLPGVVWDNRRAGAIGRFLHERIGQPLAASVRRLGEKNVLRPRPLPLRLGEFGSYTALFFLMLVAAWNAESVGLLRVPEPFRSISRYTHTNQDWRLFAPNPMPNDGWCIVAVHLADGSEIDMLTGRAVTFERPEHAAYLFPNHRWRKYFKNLVSRSHAEYREWYARHVGRTWNARHGGTDREAETMLLIYMQESTWAPADADPRPVVQQVRWRHWYRDDLRSRFYPDDDGRQEIPVIVLPVLEDAADAADTDAADMDDSVDRDTD